MAEKTLGLIVQELQLELRALQTSLSRIEHLLKESVVPSSVRLNSYPWLVRLRAEVSSEIGSANIESSMAQTLRYLTGCLNEDGVYDAEDENETSTK